MNNVEYVVKLEGKFSPGLIRKYEDYTTNLPSFSVSVEGETVIILPNPDIHLQIREARERLQQEISPLLSVMSFGEGRNVSLEVTRVVHPTLKELSTSLMMMYTIDSSQITEKEMSQRISWAMADPVYCDLLDFYTEALAAPNPRPVGYKMIERLEIKYAEGKKNGRKNACQVLGIPENALKSVVADQSRYQGDRHAAYDVGETPARLVPNERNEVLSALKRIIDAYESHVCRSTTV